MDNWTHRDIFEIAWKHFDVIAEQRLKTFNFYIVLLAASVGTALTMLEHKAGSYILFFSGLFCIGAGTVFLIVEIRTRRLLQIPKDVLTELEIGDHWPKEYRLFSTDNLKQAKFRKKIVSYSAAFRATMIAHILFGAVVLALAIFPTSNPRLGEEKELPNDQPEQVLTPQQNNIQKMQNQQVDPIVTTPVDKVEAQSTQGHP